MIASSLGRRRRPPSRRRVRMAVPSGMAPNGRDHLFEGTRKARAAPARMRPGMGLASLASIEPLLACPRCRAPLALGDDGVRCTNESCPLAAPRSFSYLGPRPVLVDFARSVLEAKHLPGPGATLESQVAHRWSVDRVPKRLRSFLKPANVVAVRNIDLLLALLPAGATVLVVGGGTIGNGTERLYTDRRVEVVAFDIYDSPLAQFVADAHQIPLADGSVDAVVVQAVLAARSRRRRRRRGDPWVLRDGGLVYAEMPFLEQVHAGPYDFVRFTASGHRYLFRRFEEIAAGPVAGPGTQLLWSVDHVVRGVARSELAGKLARALLFALRYLDRIVPEKYAVDDAFRVLLPRSAGRRGAQPARDHRVLRRRPAGRRSRARPLVSAVRDRGAPTAVGGEQGSGHRSGGLHRQPSGRGAGRERRRGQSVRSVQLAQQLRLGRGRRLDAPEGGRDLPR